MRSFADITTIDPSSLPPTGYKQWDEHGILYLNHFIPNELIDAYVEERVRLLAGTNKWRPGWNDALPYQRVPSMLELATYRPLTQQISRLIYEEPGLHLCLTGFQSTERAWHQDRYLNPEAVGEHYIAAWIALDDVHPDAGPFQCVPGSHRWPVIERQRVLGAMESPDSNTWPSDSQGWVGDACQAEIERRGGEVVPFMGKRGDVLLWHASLMHRGSKPVNPEIERRALICHYSAISVRPDMPTPRKLPNGSHAFWFSHGDVEPAESSHVSKKK